MFYLLLNAFSVILGCIIGAIAKKGIREKYVTVMNTAMGLAALVLGISVAMENMKMSNYPVLFIGCLSVGGLIGTALRFDQRMESATQKVSRGSGNDIAHGITTAVLLCCVGTLSMMGPVLLALKGDSTYMMTVATLNLVTMIVIASSYGIWTALTAIFVFLWQGGFYLIAKLSADLISDELVAETSIVGGVLIAAAGLGVMHIKDCKTINLLPALLMPLLFFLIRSLFI